MDQRPLHLIALLPFYRLIRRYWPACCEISPDLTPDVYASAMLDHGNWLYNLIFPPFFKKISFEITDEPLLRRAASDGTIVYVTHGTGQLEYNYFAHLFKEVGLPLSRFASKISLRRWMTWTQYKATLITQLETLEKNNEIAGPLASGWLTEFLEKEKTALFSLNSGELEDQSILLSYSQKLLMSAVKAKTRRPIFLVPLEFVWDKRPSRAEASIVDILFGERENPGHIRKTVLFWRNYGHRAVAKIGSPIDLTKLLEEKSGENEVTKVRHLSLRLHDIVRMERRTITGPLIRPKSWFVERVLVDETFQETLCNLAATLNKPADDLRELAARYVKEIAADINYTYIELGNIILEWVFKSLFSGLVFNQEGLAQAKRLYSKAPVVFVPNHKSHTDYLILSYILYTNNMTIPHVAAGLNLSFWPLGSFFRRCGAYFIRRSFQNNELYKLTIETYLRILLEEGYSQEFFIEGGRSRTGKLMFPRHGMLRMLTQAVTNNAIEDLHFIPVSFTYDRVIEQKVYEEELGGAAKETERPSHLLRLIKYLKRQKGKYGKIYVNFGKPVSYQEIVKENGTENIIETLAQKICREINRNTVVTPESIAAAALLTNQGRPQTIAAIEERSALFLEWLKNKGVSLSQTIMLDQNAAIATALNQLVSSHYVNRHEGIDEPVYSVEEDKRLTLDYFKNSSVHFFSSIGVVSTLFRKASSYTQEQLQEDFCICRDLLKYELRFSTARPLSEHIRKIIDFLAAKGAVYLKSDGTIGINRNADTILLPFSNMIQNFFESLKVALASVKRQSIDETNEKDLIKMMTGVGKNMLLLGYIHHHEAISNVNFQNALRLMRDLKIFSATSNLQAMNNLQVQLERLT